MNSQHLTKIVRRARVILSAIRGLLRNRTAVKHLVHTLLHWTPLVFHLYTMGNQPVLEYPEPPAVVQQHADALSPSEKSTDPSESEEKTTGNENSEVFVFKIE